MFETEQEITSAESERKYTSGDSLRAFLILVFFAGPLCGLLFYAQGRTPEMQVASLLLYTLGLFYISTNRFLDEVPWDIIIRFRAKLFLIHVPSLALIWGIMSGALALHPYCPRWFIDEGRKGSLFEWAVVALCFALCFVELSFLRKACKGVDIEGAE